MVKYRALEERKKTSTIKFISYIQSYFKRDEEYQPNRYNSESFGELTQDVVYDLKEKYGVESTKKILERVIA